MGYEYQYQYSGNLEDVIESIASASSVSSSVGWVLSIAAYVFTALALYTIAQRREIRKAWLAWIPVLDVWILGSISDQYRYVVKGENKSKRKILLTLNLINAVVYLIFVVVFVVIFVNAIMIAMDNGSEDMMIRQVVSPLMGMLGVSVLMLILSIVRAVIYYMALYDVFNSCDAKNGVLYLVLSIIPVISTVAKPLFLFLCREKDEGMPPRRVAQPAAEFVDPIWQQEAQQGKQEWYEVKSDPQEPWNNPEE